MMKACFCVEISERAAALNEIGADIQQSTNAMHVIQRLSNEE